MLEQLIVIIHILSAISVVGLILLQQGKGAEMGASFGSGASQTVLGVQGGGNFLTHATAILTTVFFITSLSLGYYAKLKTMVNTDEIIIEQPVDQSNTVSNDVPVVSGEQAEDVPVVEQAPAAAVESSAVQVQPSEVAPSVPVEAPAAQSAPAASDIPE